MLRRLAFYLLRKLINDDRRWVFVDLEEGTIMNWEVEKMELKIENETKKNEDSPYNKMFVDTKMLMNMELSGLWIDAPIKPKNSV